MPCHCRCRILTVLSRNRLFFRNLEKFSLSSKSCRSHCRQFLDQLVSDRSLIPVLLDKLAKKKASQSNTGASWSCFLAWAGKAQLQKRLNFLGITISKRAWQVFDCWWYSEVTTAVRISVDTREKAKPTPGIKWTCGKETSCYEKCAAEVGLDPVPLKAQNLMMASIGD